MTVVLGDCRESRGEVGRQVRYVLMIGTSPQTMGGIASVVNAYRAGGLFARMPVIYLSTHADGNVVKKSAVAMLALLRFMTRLAFRPNFVLHVHASSRASFWRKCVFILPTLWARRPVIFHLHGSEFMQFYEQECGRFKQGMIRRVLDGCTKIVVLSDSWRKNLSGITRNTDIEILVNPAIRDEREHSRGARQQCTVLFLGRLGRRKGIYVLLNALAAVKEKFPDVMLLCGGDGEIDEVRAVAEDLGVKDRVRLLGWVQGSEKNALLDSAAIYVLPSFAEGLPMSVLEAMAAGLPVISTPVGGIPEVITDGIEGILVAPGDSNALGEAICRLLGDADLRSRMGRNGHARFERDFSIETVLARLEAIYCSLGVYRRPKEVTGRS